jgi:AT-binding transcription factor 1
MTTTTTTTTPTATSLTDMMLSDPSAAAATATNPLLMQLFKQQHPQVSPAQLSLLLPLMFSQNPLAAAALVAAQQTQAALAAAASMQGPPPIVTQAPPLPPPPSSSSSMAKDAAADSTEDERMPMISNAAADSMANNRRRRTRITEDQLKVLRQYFDINKSPSDEQITDIARRTQLQPKVIKHWFRNTLFKVPYLFHFSLSLFNTKITTIEIFKGTTKGQRLALQFQ